MRRACLLATAIAVVWAAMPAVAPAARARCGKPAACRGKVRALRSGMPAKWKQRAGRHRQDGAPGAPDRDGAPGTTPRRPDPPPPPPPPPPVDDPRYLQVVARDSDPDRWELQPSRGALLSGTVEIEFNNRFAQDPHDLWVRRGTTTYRFDPVENGDAATRHVALAAGTWKLWCNIGDHEQRGMVAQVTVTDG